MQANRSAYSGRINLVCRNIRSRQPSEMASQFESGALGRLQSASRSKRIWIGMDSGSGKAKDSQGVKEPAAWLGPRKYMRLQEEFAIPV
jgi:hypothetical protein